MCFFRCIRYAAFGVLLFFFVAQAARAEGIESQVREWKIDLSSIAGFQFTKEKSGKNIFHATGANGRELQILRRELVSAEAAQRFVRDRTREVLSLSEAHFQGYFPNTAKSNSCPKGNRPALFEFSGKEFKLNGVEAYASARKIIGVCSESEIAYRAFLVVLHCAKKNTMYELTLFIPKEKAVTGDRKMVETFRCIP